MIDLEAIRKRVNNASVQFKIRSSYAVDAMIVMPLSEENVEFLTYAAHDVVSLLSQLAATQKMLDRAVSDLRFCPCCETCINEKEPNCFLEGPAEEKCINYEWRGKESEQWID